MTEKMKSVLITGANGFVGSHAVKKFLELDYQVIATIRSLKKSKYKTLLTLVPSKQKNLKIVEAPLNSKKSFLKHT